jgi:hypothetical protein
MIISERKVKDKCKIYPLQNQMRFVLANTINNSGKGKTQTLITIPWCAALINRYRERERRVRLVVGAYFSGDVGWRL